MSSRKHTAVLALSIAAGTPATAWAWGVPGCTNLPEYNRAQGALQGMTSACDMTVERARQVIAEHDAAPAVAPPQIAPTAPVHYRRHVVRHRHKAARSLRQSAR